MFLVHLSNKLTELSGSFVSLFIYFLTHLSVYRVCSVLTPSSSMTFSSKRNARKLARKKKTNMMLMLVSLVFFISWAPINIYNLVLDIANPFQVTHYIHLLLTKPPPFLLSPLSPPQTNTSCSSYLLAVTYQPCPRPALTLCSMDF